MPDAAAPRRSCSKLTCNREAVCTLTYVYSDSTAVIGALSARREPHAYDLCPAHADALTAPRGWRIVRLEAPGGWSRDAKSAMPKLAALLAAAKLPEPEPVPASCGEGRSNPGARHTAFRVSLRRVSSCWAGPATSPGYR